MEEEYKKILKEAVIESYGQFPKAIPLDEEGAKGLLRFWTQEKFRNMKSVIDLDPIAIVLLDKSVDASHEILEKTLDTIEINLDKYYISLLKYDNDEHKTYHSRDFQLFVKYGATVEKIYRMIEMHSKPFVFEVNISFH